MLDRLWGYSPNIDPEFAVVTGSRLASDRDRVAGTLLSRAHHGILRRTIRVDDVRDAVDVEIERSRGVVGAVPGTHADVAIDFNLHSHVLIVRE
jgi:hypothetical protein